MKPICILAAALSTLAISHADLVISEIDMANQKIEIINTGPGPENLTGYFLCNRLNGSPFYPAITTAMIVSASSSTTTLALPAGGILTLQAPAGFTPQGSGEVGLYTNNSFGSSASLLDYVGWGADGVRDSVAAAKGIWGLGTFVSVTGIQPGQTIQLGQGLAGNAFTDYSLAASTIGTNQVYPSPVATTDAVSGISDTGATLNGLVNARGVSTTVTFEYGTTPAYGQSIAASPSSVTGSADTPVSAVLTGLSPGITYHCRVVASSANGTTLGANQSFTTTGGIIVNELVVTGVSLQGNTMTVNFDAPVNVLPSAWQVEGGSNLASFPDDKTLDTTITEIPSGSGSYTALVDVTGEGANYFVRIVLP